MTNIRPEVSGDHLEASQPQLDAKLDRLARRVRATAEIWRDRQDVVFSELVRLRTEFDEAGDALVEAAKEGRS